MSISKNNLDEKILELMDYTMIVETKKVLIDILEIAQRHGDDTIDVDLYSNLVNTNILDSDLKEHSMVFIKKRIDILLSNYGIKLDATSDISIYHNILLTVDSIQYIDPNIAEPILDILEDGDESNIEKLASISTYFVPNTYIEHMEAIVYVTDNYIELTSNELSTKIDIVTNSDTSTLKPYVESLTTLATHLSSLNKTTIYQELTSTGNLRSNIHEYDPVIFTYLDNIVDGGVLDDNTLTVVASEIVAIIYLLKQPSATIISTYNESMEPMLLDGYNYSLIRAVTKLVHKLAFD